MEIIDDMIRPIEAQERKHGIDRSHEKEAIRDLIGFDAGTQQNLNMVIISYLEDFDLRLRALEEKAGIEYKKHD